MCQTLWLAVSCVCQTLWINLVWVCQTIWRPYSISFATSFNSAKFYGFNYSYAATFQVLKLKKYKYITGRYIQTIIHKLGVALHASQTSCIPVLAYHFTHYTYYHYTKSPQVNIANTYLSLPARYHTANTTNTSTTFCISAKRKPVSPAY